MTSGIITTFSIPATGTWAQGYHDYQCQAWNFQPRITGGYKKGLPETIPAAKTQAGKFWSLSHVWQDWWFELLWRASYGTFTDAQLRVKWASLTRDGVAWTDRHAWNNGFCDYVQRINLKAKPIAIKALWNGGNVGKVLSVIGRLITLECLNFSKTPPPIDDVWLKKPWLYFWASSSTWVRLPDKTYAVVAFPHLSPYGCPIPFGTDTGEFLVNKDYARVIKNGQLVRIYN